MGHLEPRMVDFIREVIEEHTIPLDEPGSGLVEAGWLVDMLFTVKDAYPDA